VIAKNGPKLQESKPGDTYPNGFKGPDGHEGMHGLLFTGKGQLTGQGVPIAILTQVLSEQLGRTVLDKTGLMGEYDFTLRWMPDVSQTPPVGQQETDSTPSHESSGPSMFTAIQDQLGLRLESKKGPVEVLVIDHVERPSEN